MWRELVCHRQIMHSGVALLGLIWMRVVRTIRLTASTQLGRRATRPGLKRQTRCTGRLDSNGADSKAWIAVAQRLLQQATDLSCSKQSDPV